MTAPLERLALALADRYRVGRELGQGGTRLKSRLGNAWRRGLRVATPRPAEPRLEPREGWSA